MTKPAAGQRAYRDLDARQEFYLRKQVWLFIENASAAQDSMSGWLLAGFGGTLAFALSNESLGARFFSPQKTDYVLWLFLISAACAFWAKRVAVMIAGSAAAIRGMLEILKEDEVEIENMKKFGVHLEMVPRQAFQHFMYDAQPWTLRRKLKPPPGDSLYDLFHMTRQFHLQSHLTQFQMLLLLLAVAFAAIWP